MKKHKVYKPTGLTKAERDWLKAQERRELIASLIVIVVGVIIIAVLIKMMLGVLGR